jgi:hypothetical protein
MRFITYFLLFATSALVFSACSIIRKPDIAQNPSALTEEVNITNSPEKDINVVLQKLENELRILWQKQTPGNVPYSVPQSELVNVQT